MSFTLQDLLSLFALANIFHHKPLVIPDYVATSPERTEWSKGLFLPTKVNTEHKSDHFNTASQVITASRGALLAKTFR